jgi:hypothetical protein
VNVSHRPSGRAKGGSQATARAAVEIAGNTVLLAVSWHPRARRFTLRLDPRTGGARLTVPEHADLDAAIAFLKRHEGWIARERGRIAAPVPFAAGVSIPLRGEPHAVRLSGAAGRRVSTGSSDGEPVIWVSGDSDMVAIRLARWLKGEARSDIGRSVARHAARLSVRPARIVLRDQRSRWGSCSSSRALSFSWRLVLAPGEVLDYVAAHEVAHLIEMNHGPRFWKLVRGLDVDVSRARRWLARHGQALHRYGATVG